MKVYFIFALATFTLIPACEIMPRNTLPDCVAQCKDSKKQKACLEFCDCIHKEGNPLDSCLDAYNKAGEDSVPQVIDHNR
jgi:hypothetical protein